METFIPSTVRPGVDKSREPSHRGEQIRLLWRLTFVGLRYGIFLCHPPGAYNFEMAPMKNLWAPNRVLQAFIRSRDRSVVIHETKMMAHTFLRDNRTRNLLVEFKNVPWTLIWVDLNFCSTMPPPPLPNGRGLPVPTWKGHETGKKAIKITQHNKINEFQ